MLTPSSAAAPPPPPNAAAVMGRLRTTMVRRRLPDDRCVTTVLDGDGEPESFDGRSDIAAQLTTTNHIWPAGNQHPQREPSADDDLLTLSSSTSCRDSTANSADVTPG